jgi:hypothetical protein
MTTDVFGLVGGLKTSVGGTPTEAVGTTAIPGKLGPPSGLMLPCSLDQSRFWEHISLSPITKRTGFVRITIRLTNLHPINTD